MHVFSGEFFEGNLLLLQQLEVLRNHPIRIIREAAHRHSTFRQQQKSLSIMFFWNVDVGHHAGEARDFEVCCQDKERNTFEGR